MKVNAFSSSGCINTLRIKSSKTSNSQVHPSGMEKLKNFNTLFLHGLKLELAKYYKDSEMTAFISEKSRNSKQLKKYDPLYFSFLGGGSYFFNYFEFLLLSEIQHHHEFWGFWVTRLQNFCFRSPKFFFWLKLFLRSISN